MKSMTGYGRGQSPSGQGAWLVELKSVNSRFLDTHQRIPSGLMGLEDRINKYLAARLSRGRVNVGISAQGAVETAPALEVNTVFYEQFREIVDRLRSDLGYNDPPSPGWFLSQRDLIIVKEAHPDLEQLWESLMPALNAALDELEAMRLAEGQELKADFLTRLNHLEELFTQAASRSGEVVEAYRHRLEERIAIILGDVEPDPQRLAQEVAIIADKCDVTEEAVRAQSHLKQFRAFLEMDEPVGRRLDFLLQELNREANTIGSKSPDAEAGQLVVELKAELERLREQVQNVE